MHTIYIRTLKYATHTVFGVENGQKTYYDPATGRPQPYSSGQQVKRCILEELNTQLNTAGSPTTFVFDQNKQGEIGEGEVYGTCDPHHADQLLGGWMHATSGGKQRTIKRRSPLSISAMVPLHPKLANTSKENITFDRSNRSNNNIIVRGMDGVEMSEEQIAEALTGKDRSLSRKWIPNNSRANGFFVQDIALDLRRLFTVQLNPLEPEMRDETIEALKESGWEEVNTLLGKSLLAPLAYRERVSKALATAIIDWRITSNQSRTFSLMETLALGVSASARNIGSSIRPEREITDDGSEKINIVVEEGLKGVETYVTPAAKAHLYANAYSANALDAAEEEIRKLIMDFDHSGVTVS